jgi:AcrR family transcriptional regulator
MLEVAAERGYAGMSVERVVARAGVSRKTFYQYFPSREQCFFALLDLELEYAADVIAAAFEQEKTWPDGLCSALASLLTFLDSEPLLARVWVVESLAAGSCALERRARNLVATLLAASELKASRTRVRALATAATGAIAASTGDDHGLMPCVRRGSERYQRVDGTRGPTASATSSGTRSARGSEGARSSVRAGSRIGDNGARRR